MTAFMNACSWGRKDVIKLLLDQSDRNINLNVKDNKGWTAFQMACVGGKKDVVKLLLKHSKVVDINIPESVALSKDIKDLIEKHCQRKYKL